MLNLKQIDHLNMNSKNLKESIHFYQKIFDMEIFEKGKSGEKDYAIIGKKGALFLCIYEDPHFEFKKEDLSHIGFHIENFNEVVAVLKDNNIPIELDYQYEKSRSIYISDPSGYEIELSEQFGGGF